MLSMAPSPLLLGSCQRATRRLRKTLAWGERDDRLGHHVLFPNRNLFIVACSTRIRMFMLYAPMRPNSSDGLIHPIPTL